MTAARKPAAKQARSTAAQKNEAPPESLEEIDEITAESIRAELKGKTLKGKIAWIQTHVGAVAKTGQVSFGNTRFSHMQEHGLINVIRPLMRLAGVGVMPGATSPGSWTQNGNVWVIDYALTIFDVETDEELTRWFPNVGVDSADKGLNKAYTGAMKYALQKIFLVPTDDIDDNETIDVAALPANAQAAAERNDRPTEDEIAKLRSAILDAGVPAATVVNVLTATYKKSGLSDLTRAEFSDFEQRATKIIADAQPSA
jgi:hypothetical protein